MSTLENTKLSKSYIIDALFYLMDKKDFNEITVSEIVKKAGVGRATFYRYYKSREEIVQEYFLMETKKFVESMSGDPRNVDEYYEMVFAIFLHLKREKLFFQRLVSAHMESLYLDFLNKMILRNFRENKYSEYEYAAYYMAGSLFNVSLAWIKRDCRENVKYMADKYSRLLNIYAF